MLVSSTVKMEATVSSEMSIDFHPTARRGVPDDKHVQRASSPHCVDAPHDGGVTTETRSTTAVPEDA
jgi:hypothetical protein